jgi:uncharacterized protein YbjT (DUF2867 family)
MTILVTGATGHVGAELVAQLADAGHDVRAMTRRPDRYIAGPRVHAVAGDADDPTGLTAAFDGVDRAFLMSAEVPGAAQRPTHLPRLAQAAERAGVHHVVLLSVYSGAEGGDVLADWSRQVEEAVTGSEMTWTLLRPGRFMSNALQWAPQIRRSSEITIPFAFRPAASIDPADIAAVAAASLLSDDHHGAAHRLTGPEVLNPVQELAVLAELLHRPLRAMDPPLADVRAGMTRGGMPEVVVDAVLDRTLHGDEGTHVLPTVTDILGRPPTTFRDWATRHLDRFTD